MSATTDSKASILNVNCDANACHHNRFHQPCKAGFTLLPVPGLYRAFAAQKLTTKLVVIPIYYSRKGVWSFLQVRSFRTPETLEEDNLL